MQRKLIIYLFIISTCLSCNGLVKVDPPQTDLLRSAVFTKDETANAAAIDMYAQLGSAVSLACGGTASISFYGALSADEVTTMLAAWLPNIQRISDNNIDPAASEISDLWGGLYKVVYRSNAVLEGIADSKLTPALVRQMEGEALFLRAFAYFYLVNFFGDVPMVLSTDYKQSTGIGRMPAATVYEKILSDLETARPLLDDGYAYSGGERARANRGAVDALRARAFLYTGDWENAEATATSLINNATDYGMPPLDQVFLRNSREAIFQLQPEGGYTMDALTGNYYVEMRPSLIADFEAGDQRKAQWTQDLAITKYRSITANSFQEYSMVFRLAEQYLIRAEARTQLENVDGAQDDINEIRHRAGLGNTDADDKATLLEAIAQERRIELCLEWAHRWLDLKRTGRATTVLSAIKAGWKATDVLYPLPEGQVLLDKSTGQTDGY